MDNECLYVVIRLAGGMFIVVDVDKDSQAVKMGAKIFHSYEEAEEDIMRVIDKEEQYGC